MKKEVWPRNEKKKKNIKVKRKEEKKSRKENYEVANKSKQGSSLEDEGNEEPEIKEEGTPDPVDSFNPQEYVLTSVQEGSGKSYTTKELNESREVETTWKSRSTNELDKLDEGDAIEQVL